MALTELAAMRHALTLAALRIGGTSPNPPVGCVILNPHGELLGAGYHQRKGEPHAEVNALRAAHGHTHDATAVVTLEPCCHTGATPACHQALLDAGIARVVVALEDPTSRGQGGIALLRQAGVDVETGVAETEARSVLGPWLHSIDHQRPYLIAATTDSGDDQARRWLRSRLAAEVDLVVDEDGKVTEAIPGSHDPVRLGVPSQPLTGDLSEVISALSKTGARRVLLLTDSVRAPLATDGRIDRLVFLTHEPETPSLPPHAAVLPPSPSEWALEAFHPCPGGVIADYRRNQCVES
ncbi:bifunctional diaminohydroxyphosphoribosylaminopyrimidine deaminase/5-amino-6-(5-phosphoribosylamino)uracil reductase RibD [Saccharopolyspora endophytica]|uniref:diaminohydroxyphosphoribosylaminopyrimidine deaminase n=1 Tax=Saccharopolyspora endophytica TaxID=543886 RepID=A0ABS5D9Z4_9PSEU|nr:bifunctional diaminohydroxyphosphoribosylaminopyrimidine deaminase/5-amino-6-(5-phosphoribosylamino)uracil reductase RibD [Saccharopolyspora endophytica]MBQ0923108.1 bifunctional diaminohydroxyphosphoribosylaminopyrimidine deaminase/5-amino-6-(5-phosphoribosylamino)uracil reductase RibD [Saccharopolyspora endophytica]